MTDLAPARLRALADEWLMLDLQASMTETEIARYEKLPLLMATALGAVADWRAGLEAQNARLTGALQAIAAHGNNCGCHQATFINIARAALKDERD